MNIKDLVEAKVEDIYPENFHIFREKYKKLPSVERQKLYVQFTNFADNTLDRRAFDNPDHKDPMGIYAYPIDYVLKYPADIWYGKSAKYLRVLQSTSKKPLFLQYKNAVDFDEILRSMGIKDIENKKNTYKKLFPHRIKGQNKEAKLFFGLVQLDIPYLDKNDFKRVKSSYGWGGNSSDNLRVRSAKEQTELFLKAGFDSIVDNSKSASSAIINYREPEQIIFLTRSSFIVKEVYNLRTRTKDILTIDDKPIDDRKLANNIAEIMDDKLNSTPAYTTNQNGYSLFWTKKGRRISIYVGKDAKYYDDVHSMKIGKKHKMFKDYDATIVDLKVDGEFGNIQTSIERDEGVEDLKNKFVKIYSQIKNNVDKSWEPENFQSFVRKQDEKRQKFLWDKHKEEIDEFITYAKKNLEKTLNDISKNFINKFPNLDDNQWAVFYDLILSRLKNMYINKNNYKIEIPKILQELENKIKLHKFYKDIDIPLIEIENFLLEFFDNYYSQHPDENNNFSYHGFYNFKIIN